MFDLRLGDWRDTIPALGVDVLIVDSPYGERTHKGHDAGVDHAAGDYRGKGAERRAKLGYDFWTPDHVHEFVASWAPRVLGWFCAFSCSDLAVHWRAALEGAGRVTFAPVACVIRAMSVRLSGDGPSSWVVYLNVARPRSKEWAAWGTLPGAYVVSPDSGPNGRGSGIAGGKPLTLMRAVIRDYTRPGDLVCDPCAGLGTTGIAAVGQGRRFIGSELDPETHRKALERYRAGVQLELG